MGYESLVSLSDAGDYQTAMQQLHATFARPITIYQTATQMVIATSPTHNFLYPDTPNNPNNTQVSDIVSSGVYLARIHYAKEQKTEIYENSELGANKVEQLNVKNKIGDVKIILDATGFAVAQTCTRVLFDSMVYQIRSDPRPHGVVGVYFYNLYLTPLS